MNKMDKFYCPKCDKIFEAEGKKKEWQDSIYGYCWKRTAKCPICGTECEEYRPSGPSTKKSSPKDYPFPKCACGD
jgi:hypothetical protein